LGPWPSHYEVPNPTFDIFFTIFETILKLEFGLELGLRKLGLGT